MKKIILGLLFLFSCAGNSAKVSPLEYHLMNFPMDKLVDEDDIEARLIMKEHRKLKFKNIPTDYTIDPKKGYAIFEVPDNNVLELRVWGDLKKGGFIAVNRMPYGPPKFSLWKYSPPNSYKESLASLPYTRTDLERRYKQLTGETLPKDYEIYWWIPQFKNGIILLFNAFNEDLKKHCKIENEVEYDCGNNLEIMRFKWKDGKFHKVLSK